LAIRELRLNGLERALTVKKKGERKIRNDPEEGRDSCGGGGTTVFIKIKRGHYSLEKKNPQSRMKKRGKVYSTRKRWLKKKKKSTVMSSNFGGKKLRGEKFPGRGRKSDKNAAKTGHVGKGRRPWRRKAEIVLVYNREKKREFRTTGRGGGLQASLREKKQSRS